MRNLAESYPSTEPSSTPEFTITEKGEIKKKRPSLVSDREKTNKDYVEAEKNLIGKQNLYADFLEGFLLKYRREPGIVGSFALPFAKVNNKFMADCLNLTNKDINELVQKFNTGFKEYLQEKTGAGSDFTEEKHLGAEGIISVVRYIESKREFYKDSPESVHYFFENNLDARYAVDLLEVVTGVNEKGEKFTKTINLVQVKSKELLPNEREDIRENHREYYKMVNSFELRERNIFLDNLTKEILLKNAGEVKELIYDICTDPKGFDPDIFISNLNIKDLNDRHKVSLLLRYLAVVERYVPVIRKDKKKYELTDKDIDTALEALKKLEDKVMQLKQKINTNGPQINSVIAYWAERGLETEKEELVEEPKGKILNFKQKK